MSEREDLLDRLASGDAMTDIDVIVGTSAVATAWPCTLCSTFQLNLSTFCGISWLVVWQSVALWLQ